MDVALVAVVAPNIENHSVAVLRGALEEAGHTTCVIPFDGFGSGACRFVFGVSGLVVVAVSPIPADC